MHPTANGSGECRSANNARGARRASAGAIVNSTENGVSNTAAASSWPTRCCTGAGRFCAAPQHAIPWQQQHFTQTFPVPAHALDASTNCPPAMLKSIASTASNRVIWKRLMVATCEGKCLRHSAFVKPSKKSLALVCYDM